MTFLLFLRQHWKTIGIALILIGIYGAGYKQAFQRCELERLEAVERALAQREAMEAENQQIEEAFHEQTNETRVVYKTIYRELAAAPASPNCSVNPERMRVLVRAIRPGSSTEDTGKSEDSVQGSAATGRTEH